MNFLLFLVPEGINDATRPSGGNNYDRKLIDSLRAQGFTVVERAIAGAWPTPIEAALTALAAALAEVADGSVVLIDGLIASASGEVLIPHSHRLRILIIMHMPLGSQSGSNVSERAAEQVALAAASAVIVTSNWTRNWLVEHYGIRPELVHLAEPGVEPSEITSLSPHGGRFICLAAVVPHKGQDILVEALARLTEHDWVCHLVGNNTLDQDFVARLRRRIHETDLATRIQLVGPRVGEALASTFASTDLLVAPSRSETYGMVVTEALARGIPVIASTVGGLPTTLGIVKDHGRPGMLVPPEDSIFLADALQTWLMSQSKRQWLRELALRKRGTLNLWSDTARDVSRVILRVAA